ncbi:MAG TPA: tetratricopeptide repeat protein [Chitinophagaceae bacterium]
MMKRMFYILFCYTIVIFFSCNNNEEQSSASSTNKIQSAEKLKKDIQKFPDSLLLLEKLIQYYRDNGAYDSALTVTDNTIKRVPEVAGLWDIKATLHFENGDTINAIRSFEKAIDIAPLPEYIMSLATIYAETKNPKALMLADALLYADKAKASKQAIFIKGLYYNYTGDKKKAIALFDSCIRLDYTYMFAYREKAIALYDEGKYEDAVAVLTKAVTVQNNFDEGYYWLGNCYKKLNKKEEAIQSYHTALMYDKDFIEARDSLKTLEGNNSQ